MTSFYLTVAIKLALGLISLVFVINLTGKGNLAPSSATDQVQNFVLGAILGGTIYSSTVSILQYIVILIIGRFLILLLKWLITNILFYQTFDLTVNQLFIIKHGQLDPEACRSKGLSASDVALKLRSQGIFQLKEVKRALLNRTAN